MKKHTAAARYFYRLRQTNPGRFCLLTRDCVALAAALNEPHHHYGQICSDVLIDPASVPVESGVIVDRIDRWPQVLEHEKNLLAMYGTEERVRAIGCGDVLDHAATIRVEQALALNSSETPALA